MRRPGAQWHIIAYFKINMRILELSMEIIKLTYNSVIIKCAFCEGKGSFPNTAMDADDYESNEPCPICNGKGVLVEYANQDDLLDCALCNGTGRKYDECYFQGDVCVSCNGRGYFDTREEEGDVDFWLEIHPKIKELAQPRFESEHYADGIEAGLKEINDVIKKKVREICGDEYDGSQLMNKAFSIQNPLLKLCRMDTQSGKDEQLGYMQIFAGAMTGIRNPKAHSNVTIEYKIAKHLLYLVSLLMYRVDEIV